MISLMSILLFNQDVSLKWKTLKAPSMIQKSSAFCVKKKKNQALNLALIFPFTYKATHWCKHQEPEILVTQFTTWCTDKVIDIPPWLSGTRTRI